jgi:Protein of unknown function (DUF4230)
MKLSTKILLASSLSIGIAGFGAFLFMPSAVSNTAQSFIGKVQKESNIRTSTVSALKGTKELVTAQADINITTDATIYSSGISEYLGIKNQVVYTTTGTLKAGYDLSQITEDAIRVSGNVVTITLPVPKIISSYLDTEHQVIYDHRDLFAPATSPEVLGMAQHKANESLNAQSCSSGILNQANEKAPDVFKGILQPIGVSQVLVVATAPNCPVVN